MTRCALAVALVLSSAACGGEIGPADVTPADACAFCRMTVSDPRLAAQIIVPGEEPRFFDDIGCLVGWLKEHDVPDGSTAWVADHRTGRWAQAADALFTKSSTVATPMGSGIIAHADQASRDADPGARDGNALTAGAVFGTARVPRSSHAR